MRMYKRFMQDGGAMPQEQAPQAPAPQPQGQAPQGQAPQEDPMQILQQMVGQYAQTMDPALAEEIAQFLMELFNIQPQQAPTMPQQDQGASAGQVPPAQGEPVTPTMRQGGPISRLFLGGMLRRTGN